MLHPVDWIIIILFFLLSAGIALFYRKSAGKDLNSFFLGGRNLPWYIAGISMVATTFAADTPLAVTELVYIQGIAGNWLWWSFLAGGMFTTFFFARLWRKAEVLTEVELIELRYSGKAAAWLRGFKAVYLGLFMNVLIIGWVNLAMIAILKVFFEVPEDTIFFVTALAMLVAAFYSALSGLKGVAITDAVQFIIAMGGTIALAVIVIKSEEIGGISGLKAQLPAESLNFLPDIGAENAGVSTLTLGIGSFLAYIGVQWWASWYPGAEPGGGGYIAQRMMSTKTERDALYATLFFQVAHYCIRPWPWILVGLACVVLYPDLTGGDIKESYVIAMKTYLPDGLRGLLLVAFFAAYLSTISTQLNWGASYLVNDGYKRFLKPGASDKNLVLTSRLTTLLIMLLALVATSFMESISGVWVFIIECGAGLGLVLILRWFWWRINAWTEITATLAPFVGFAIFSFVFNFDFPDRFFYTVLFTTICWLIVTLTTSPSEENQLKKFWSRVQPGGWWPDRLKNSNMAKTAEYRYLFIAWILSVVMTYALLFTIGKLILGFYVEGIIAMITAILAFSGMLIAMKKTTIHRNQG